jgi:NADPH:quinone reductase-like Zn-dependent oxidoreductase
MHPHHDSDEQQTLTEIVLPGLVEPDEVLVRHRPVPIPGAGQALVEMRATGVSFAENSMRRGRYPGQPRFPFVPGYDLVGDVLAVGEDVDRGLVGRRVAAVTKTGGWTTHAVLDARDLIVVAEDLDPGEVETVLLNGVTAWQMLHRAAGPRRGRTVLVHGASGGVGSTLAQLARHAGIRVIGTASPRHHDWLRELGVEPIDYRDPQLAGRVRELAPDGVDAVFDNIGGASFTRSFDQLARGGTLVGYGTASQLEDENNMVLTFAGIMSRFALWSALPNGRRATFYNFWGGSRVRPSNFRGRLAEDLGHVLDLLREGALTARVATRLPLVEASRALSLADARQTPGKVVLVP